MKIDTTQYEVIEYVKSRQQFLLANLHHQRTANNFMEINSKGTLEYPTGTGKTRIIIGDLFSRLERQSLDVFTIASHRLMLNLQHTLELITTLKYAIPNVAFVFVGSSKIDYELIKHSIGSTQFSTEINQILKKYNQDKLIEDRVTMQEIVTTCTSIASLDNTIAEHKLKQRDVIIITTYHSLHKLQNQLIDTFYGDEAHILAANDQFESNFNKINAKRQFFFTATPKVSTDNDAIMRTAFVMNNPSIFGDFCSLTLKDAIDQHLIVPPIYHIMRSQKMTDDASKSGSHRGYVVLNAYNEHEKWLKSISAEPTKIDAKILVKCKNVDDIWAIEKYLINKKPNDITVFAIASRGSTEDDGLDLIDCNMKVNGKEVNSRGEFLKQLRELAITEKAIILHYNILSEGIDVPSITGVMFMTESIPPLPTTLQTIGRGMRLHPIDRSKLHPANGVRANTEIALVKPQCAIIIPIFNDDTEKMATSLTSIITNLRAVTDFENETIVSIDEKIIGTLKELENPNNRLPKDNDSAMKILNLKYKITHEIEQLNYKAKQTKINNDITTILQLDEEELHAQLVNYLTNL